MAEVLAFKMIGGDEVVASVVKTITEKTVLAEKDGSVSTAAIKAYVVRKPHILRFQPVAPGQIGLAFVPWTLSNPEIAELEIPASAVVLTYKPSEQVKTQYLSQTTGLDHTKPSGLKI